MLLKDDLSAISFCTPSTACIFRSVQMRMPRVGLVDVAADGTAKTGFLTALL